MVNREEEVSVCQSVLVGIGSNEWKQYLEKGVLMLSMRKGVPRGFASLYKMIILLSKQRSRNVCGSKLHNKMVVSYVYR